MGMLGTVGGVVGSYWGPVGSAIGSAAGSALDSSMEQEAANKYNSAEAVSAYGRQREARQTAYQDTMADLKAAGLNPMLAINNGVTQLPSVMAGSYPVGAGAATVTAAASAKQAETQSRQTDTQVEKMTQEITNLKTENERAKALIDVAREQYQNLIKEGFNLTEVGNNLRATFNKLKAETSLVNEQSFRTEVNRQLDEIELKAAQTFEGSGAAARQIKPILDLIRALFPRVRN